MTISIANQSPAPSDQNVSSKVVVSFSLISDDPLNPVLQSTIQVTYGGRDFIVNGQPQSGLEATIEPNASLGFDITLKQELPDNTAVEVAVVAAAYSTSWQFETGDFIGPRAISISPTPFVDGVSATPVITFTLIDDNVDRQPATAVVEQTSTDGERTGNQLHSDTIDFRNRQGRLIDVNGTPNIIQNVLGPHDAETDLSGAASGATLDLYANRGLDVWVYGEHLVQNGVDVSSGDWTVVVTPTGNQIDVSITRTGPALVGQVDVQVLVTDDDPVFHNTSLLNWFYKVGDQDGPFLSNISPANGTKGLVDSPPDSLVFDITDNATGVDSATLDVEVDGVAAITAGAGVGDFSGSTVIAIAGGYTVTLNKGTDWTDGDQVFVDIAADDNSGNHFRGMLNYHFGQTLDTSGLSTGDGNLPEDDIKRVVAFDLSNTSFGKPVELKHTGYAYDGRLYSNGSPDDDSPTAATTAADNLASWFTESAGPIRGSQAEFPLSGYVVATPNYWTILDQNGDMWMTCQVSGSASPDWSMAGGAASSIVDADFGEDATLFVACEGMIAVDFVNDRAIRYGTEGREVSTFDISGRNGSQDTGAYDPSYALTTNMVDRVAGVAFQRGLARSQVAVVCNGSGVDIVSEISSEFLSAEGKVSAAKVASLSFTSPTWRRARISADDPDGVPALMLMRDEAGQAKLSTYNWLSVVCDGATSPLTTFDNTNDLPAEAGADFDAKREAGVWLLAVATDGYVTFIEVASNGASSLQSVQRSLADLGMVFGTNPRLLSVAMESNFEYGLGYAYVSGTEDGATGRLVRYREQSSTALTTGQVTQLGADVVDSIDAMGSSELGGSSLLRASLEAV